MITRTFSANAVSTTAFENNDIRVFTLNNTLLLYAFLVYRLNQGNGTITKEQFSERIRIVRNLLANSSFEIREQNMGQLLRETETIVKQGTIDTESVSFNKTQKGEEVDKMKWRREWPAYIAKLNELEDHYLLNGAIAAIGLANGPDFGKGKRLHETFRPQCELRQNQAGDALLGRLLAEGIFSIYLWRRGRFHLARSVHRQFAKAPFQKYV